MNTQKELNHFKSELKKSADPKRSEGEKKYLKSPMKHYGASIWDIRKIVKAWIRNNQDTSIKEIVTLADELWESKYHEDRMVAIILLELKKDELTLSHMPIIEKMISTVTGWAQLDGIAVWLVGALIDKDKNTLSYLEKWIKSANYWVRRTAILAQITQFRKSRGDFKLFERLVVPQFKEGKNWDKRERFFIRKAIGWTLRERAPSDPDSVYKFVENHLSEMSGLTFRESIRKLPAKMQKELTKQRLQCQK